MSESGSDGESETLRKWFYPTKEQWTRWKAEMEARGYNTPNQFVQAMVEAGLKKFERPVAPDETVHDLREQRNDLKQELDRVRERNARLEEQLFQTDQAAAIRYLQENPEAGFEAVLDHVETTLPQRLTRLFEHVEAAGGDPEAMRRSETARLYAEIAQDYVEKKWDEGRPDPHPRDPEEEQR